MFDPKNVELPMRPARVTECLAAIGWSQAELSRRLKMYHDTGRQWAKGKRNIPYVAARWLELLAASFDQVPRPEQPWAMPWSDMTGENLAAALHELSWTQKELAYRLNCTLGAVHHMLTGNRPIGADVACWLSTLCGILQAAPLPEDWRKPVEGEAA